MFGLPASSGWLLSDSGIALCYVDVANVLPLSLTLKACCFFLWHRCQCPRSLPGVDLAREASFPFCECKVTTVFQTVQIFQQQNFEIFVHFSVNPYPPHKYTSVKKLLKSSHARSAAQKPRNPHLRPARFPPEKFRKIPKKGLPKETFFDFQKVKEA